MKKSKTISELLIESSLLKQSVTLNKQKIQKAKDIISEAYSSQQKLTNSAVREMLDNFIDDNKGHNRHYTMSHNESSEFTKYVRRSGACINSYHGQAMAEFNRAKENLAETLIDGLVNASDRELDHFVKQCALKNLDQIQE